MSVWPQKKKRAAESMRPSVKRHLMSLLTMCVGSFGVFFVVFFMNADKPPPKTEKDQASTAFEVQQKQPKKKKKKKRRARKKKVQRRRSRTLKAPNLSASISQASFEMAGFDTGQFGLSASSDLVGSFSKKGAMTEGTVDRPAKPRRRVSGRYPDDARKRGVTGYVQLNMYVNERGEVERIKVLDSKPKGTFEVAAKEAAQQWEFKPAEYQGEAVAQWVKQKMVFTLGGG